jgi:hypothetical protein
MRQGVSPHKQFLCVMRRGLSEGNLRVEVSCVLGSSEDRKADILRQVRLHPVLLRPQGLSRKLML